MLLDASTTPVWTYWSGPMQPWVGMCLETLRRHCPTLRVLDDQFFADEYDGSIPIQPFFHQPIHQRSNVLRAFLLARHGGVWVDADCIALRDLARLSEVLQWHDFVCYQQQKGGICSALLAARYSSPTALRYWKAIKRQSLANIRRKRWGRLSLGPRCVRQALQESGWHGYCVLPSHMVHPIYWKDRLAFASDQQPKIHNDAWCWMLTSGSLGDLRTWSREQILNSQTVIGRVFRHALGMG